MNDNIIRLFSRLQERGVRVDLQDDQLKISILEGGALPQDLLAELKARKSEIIDFFQQQKGYKDIDLQEKKAYYQISSMQGRMYFLQQITPGSTSYNISEILSLSGKIDITKLTEILNRLIARHESLRTCFAMVGDGPVQRVLDRVELELEVFRADGRSGQGGQSGQELIELIIKEFIRPFDLAVAPLIRVGLINTGEDRYILLVDMHHIISDGTSIGILIKEFVALYSSQSLPPLKLRYIDFAEWQASQGQREILSKQEQYWLEKFTGEIPVLQLPTDFQRPTVQGFNGRHVDFFLAEKELKLLKELTAVTNATLYVVLLSIAYIWLTKLTGQEDIVLGTPVAGRQYAHIQEIIGMFVNTLPLRAFSAGEKRFDFFLEEVKEIAFLAFQNQDYHLEDLVEKVVINRDMSRNPLFDVMFGLQNIDIPKLVIPGLEITPYNYDSQVAKFDLTLMAKEDGAGLNFYLGYASALFKEETIARFGQYYLNILDNVLADPSRRIGDIEFMAQAEREQLLEEFSRGTGQPYPGDKTLVELFSGQVVKTPDRIALVGANNDSSLHGSVSYKELDRLASSLAGELMAQGVMPNTIVALQVERSIEMIVGMLGILKAGGAYLPIDPEAPEERVQYMLADSGAEIVFGSQTVGANCCSPIQDIGAECKGERQFAPTDLAYVIYTSGSTGRPKGVMIGHHNLCPLLHWGYEHLALTPDDRTIQNLSYFFDWSAWEIFITLTSGASLHLINRDILLNPRAMVVFMQERGITVLHCTPSQFQYLLNENLSFDSLGHLCLGAEKLDEDLLKRSLAAVKPDCRVYNMYGPTEATIMAAVLEIDKQGLADYGNRASMPIGRFIGNTELWVLDRYLHLCPVRVAGELYIGGAGLARGYLNNPELTAERFVTSPITTHHSPLTTHPSPLTNRLYRTGDLCRWLNDGTIEFLGRIDFQVKIRGFRIELGEIEAQLLKHPEIKETVVLALGEGNEKHLCAYLVAKAGQIPETQTLHDFLSHTLPAYMIPAHFVFLEQMPLNANGKVDRKALPQPEISPADAYRAPENSLEEALVDIWSEVLKVEKEKIGTGTSFFDLGGHSLKATRVTALIKRRFAVDVSLADIFKGPTIREMAQSVARGSSDKGVLLKSVDDRDYYDLSYAQRRLWVLCQFEGDSTAYNIPAAILLQGNLDLQAFKTALQLLIERHESLRTVFFMIDSQVKQKVLKHLHVNVDMVDLQDYPERKKQEQARSIYRKTANHVFDLERGPLIYIRVIRLTVDRYLLVWNTHHIISDGWSMGNINNDFILLYNAVIHRQENPLPALKLQYKDYSTWHNNLIIGGEEISGQRLYWLDKLKDKPNGIELPFDFQRRSIQTFNGGRIHFILDLPRTQGLRDLCRRQDCTLFMGLLNLLTIFLFRTGGQKDIILGSPIANRKQVELAPLVGFFVNTLVYRIAIDPEKSFTDLLAAVKEEALQCYEYQDYPFDLLVEQLGLERDLSQSPLFNVMIAHNNTETGDRSLRLEGLEISPFPFADDFNMSKFDLIFFMDERDDQVIIRVEYNSDLFRQSSIERMTRNFLHLTEEVLSHPDRAVKSLDVIAGAEYEQVVYGFNDYICEFKDITLAEMFEEQVEKSGEAIAVVSPDGERTIDYRELNGRSNQVAHYLRREYGIKANDIIGVSMDRSIEMIVVLLGIIKSGAAYLAVDPTYPRERVLHVLADSDSDMLFIDRQRPELFDGYPGRLIVIGKVGEKIASMPKHNPQPVNQGQDVLYVNYTSGSTGTPNGAMLSHDCLTNLIQWQKEKTGIACSGRVLQFTSINFCVSFQEIMGTLTSGGELHLIGDIERQDIDYLMNFLGRRQVNVLFLPFSYLNFLFNESNRWDRDFRHSLQHIITAGEQLKVTAGLKRFLDLNPNIRLHNHYGSTEMHVVTSYTLDAFTADQTPIPPAGKPISNVKIFILDDNLQPVPMGVWGELCVEGRQEILGYIKNPELTDKKLVRQESLSKKKLYRSGDIGRWLPDGNIELRGRKDTQVKVRGFRVELGEIESRVLGVKGVRECVVVVKEDGKGIKGLVGYVSLAGIDIAEVRRAISGLLPQYMVPRFVVVESLPLMPNGKVDREKLPVLEWEEAEEYMMPANEIEVRLKKIWSELLAMDNDQISVTANFFSLGGHSLKATIMMGQIQKEFAIKIPLEEIFKRPTIREIGQLVASMERSSWGDLEKGEEKEYYHLSYNQKRLFVIHRLNPQSSAFNMSGKIDMKEDVDERVIGRVIAALVARHEGLRTRFIMRDNRPVQVIEKKVDLPFRVEDISRLAEAEKLEQREKVYEEILRTPFDIGRAPLLRTLLMKTKAGEYELLFNMHHIISDGWSMEILKRDFSHLLEMYRQGLEDELPGLDVQYRDFADWQNRLINNKENKQEAHDYWQKRLASAGWDLALPRDFTVNSDDNRGAGYHCRVDRELLEQLKGVSLTYRTSLFGVMFAIYITMLGRYSGQDDVPCSIISAGREDASLYPVIGFFVNSLLFKIDVNKEEVFADFLGRVHEEVMGSLRSQGYPVELVLEEMGMRHPEIKVSFNMVNLGDLGEEVGYEVNGPHYEVGVQDVKFDIELYVREYSQGLGLDWRYRKGAYKPATIEFMAGEYHKLLAFFAADPGKGLLFQFSQTQKRRTFSRTP